MIRKSSLEAFRALQESGDLTLKQLMVLEFFIDHQDTPAYGDMITRADIEVTMKDNTQSLGPRFAELERFGLLQVHGRKVSVKTKRSVQGWRLLTKFDADKIKNYVKKLTTKQALEQLIVEAEALVPELRSNRTPLLCATALEQAVSRARSRTKRETS